MIELFSGSKIVSGVFQKYGYKTFTVDIDPKLKPDICEDICNLNSDLLPLNPSFIWASPDCTKFSRAGRSEDWIKTVNKYRQYTYLPNSKTAVKALQMINSTIDIITYFKNVDFVIENPIGRIHHTNALKRIGHYRYAVNYADFGFPYSKETYLFTNLWLPFSTTKVHSSLPGLRSINNRKQRSKVPPELIEKIILYAL